jgi:hypothetical protein
MRRQGCTDGKRRCATVRKIRLSRVKRNGRSRTVRPAQYPHTHFSPFARHRPLTCARPAIARTGAGTGESLGQCSPVRHRNPAGRNRWAAVYQGVHGGAPDAARQARLSAPGSAPRFEIGWRRSSTASPATQPVATRVGRSSVFRLQPDEPLDPVGGSTGSNPARLPRQPIRFPPQQSHTAGLSLYRSLSFFS